MSAVDAATTMAPEVIETQSGRLAVRGALTFATARRALEAGRLALGRTDTREIEIDCGAVTAADSAGLAVLLDWLAWARGAGRTLRLMSVPASVHAIARISEVEELLDSGV